MLRFLGWPHIPFMHDEVSALVRIYPSLGETISRGVVELDTHPPGVQIFEWLWTRAFGVSEGMVKMPFMLLSLAAIFFLYRFALLWTSAAAALALTALLATLQFEVLYGQIARPYALGAFTIALLADQWGRYIAWGKIRNLVWVGVGSVLSAYTHHFALLVAFPDHGQRPVPSAARAMEGILDRLRHRDTGLPAEHPDHHAPTRSWRFAGMACHTGTGLVRRSPLVGAALLGDPGRGRWAGCCAFAHRLLEGPEGHLADHPAPAALGGRSRALGYAYSVWRAPVLQHSVLLFSFPFLLLAVLGGLQFARPLFALSTAGALAVVATFTLFTERMHDRTFLNSKYEAFLQAAVDAQGSGKTMVALDAPPEVLDFLEQEPRFASAKGHYIRLRELSGASELIARIAQQKPDTIVLGFFHSTDRELPALIQRTHPALVERVDLVEGQLMRFAQQGEGITDHTAWTGCKLPGTPTTGWTVDAPLAANDSIAEEGWDLSGREYGMLYEAPLYTVRAPNDVLEVLLDATVLDEPALDLELVLELHSTIGAGRDTIHFYRSMSARTCAVPLGSRGTLVAAVPFTRGALAHRNLRLRTYAFNRKSGKVRLHGDGGALARR
ncbi:MAG: glycosyltransferase family 39 protein [Flavobacteriales bacterium]|nr:glycosyltransferase family 39 protein [Flavobacteriales bacterium]